MKAETKKCDFDPLSLQGFLGASRLVHAMKVPFWTPKCQQNSNLKRDFILPQTVTLKVRIL